MIAIIDYGMGNLRSVRNAVDYCGYDCVVTDDPAQIANASHIILPGVGAFGDAIANLRARGLDETLNREVRERGKPTLGVCVGLQIMASVGLEHGRHQGLGWIDGEVARIEPTAERLKIPHMGWNAVALRRDHPAFARMKPAHLVFYFVHSYHLRCRNDADLLGEAWYGQPLTAAIARDNLVATQFHPEKSQDSGLELLEGFLRWNP